MMSQGLCVRPIQTEIFREGEDLVPFILENLKATGESLEGQIVVITSKIMSLSEGAVRAREKFEKKDLIKDEAEYYLGEIAHACHLTIKHGLLIVTAGIDLSNSENADYILLPKNPFESTKNLYLQLKAQLRIKNFGVLVTDSRTLPLRRGVSGCGLAYYGFKAVKNMIGATDLFGRRLEMTQINFLDALASSAVMMMGEADECRPLALISGAPVEFCDEQTKNEVLVEPTEDLYYPMYRDLIAKYNNSKKEET